MKNLLLSLTLFIGSCTYFNYNHLVVMSSQARTTDVVVCDDISVLKLQEFQGIEIPKYTFSDEDELVDEIRMLVDYTTDLENALKEYVRDYGCKRIK